VKGRNLPIRRKDFDVQGFVAFVAEQGGEIGMPTNAYEVCRYKAFWRGTSKIATHIVYAKENGLLAFTGSSLGHYRAYLDGAPMEELPGAPSKPKTAAAKTVSKSAKARAKLIERDGDGCNNRASDSEGEGRAKRACKLRSGSSQVQCRCRRSAVGRKDRHARPAATGSIMTPALIWLAGMGR
jgi:hypothetical protein